MERLTTNAESDPKNDVFNKGSDFTYFNCDHEIENDILNETKHLENEHIILYKKNEGLPDQTKRRENLLKEQKKRRNELTDEARGLSTEKDESMEIEQVFMKQKKYNKFRECRNKTMLSEWLIDVPDDLDVNWFIKICPLGHRCIVIAQKNITKQFTKNGIYECSFMSVLPGGTSEVSRKGTILDCIWVSNINTFFVLDVLKWAGQDLTQYDSEFRFFWLQSKIQENEELSYITSNNNFKFIYTNHFPSDCMTISRELENYPYYPDEIPKVDGILFYHKEASYAEGRTPLVGWLKPYMVPEVLNVPVATEYLNAKPARYKNLKQHIEYSHLKKKRFPKVDMKMEV